MSEIDDILSGFGAQTVLCVGDLMLDEYVYGQVSRISPEAATPVLAIARRELQIGGAGNAARNIAGLGANCIFVGVVGDDDAGRVLASEFRATPRLEAHLTTDRSRPTTRKVRFVSEQHSTHLLRADWETTAALASAIEAAAIENILAALPRAGALLLSDYAKGMLTPRLIQTAIAAARQASVPVIVDPKGSDYSVYRGATVITPNRKELGEATRLPVATTSEIEAAAGALAREIACDAVVVTRSEEGMSLYRRSGEATHIAAYPVRVRDVSGAGDTGAAVLATCLAMRADLAAALRVSNAAAAVVVGKRGTATVEPGELRARLETPATRPAEPKVASDRAGALAQVEAWRRQGLRVGFTNGCFDLLHPGHVKLLTAARAACDRLVVGLNSDASVAALKGPGRPIQGENARAAVLAALEAVDLVVIFAEQTPLELVRSLRPDLLVKGADYQLHEVVGRDIVEAGGGEVLLIELLPGFSTSALAAGREKR